MATRQRSLHNPRRKNFYFRASGANRDKQLDIRIINVTLDNFTFALTLRGKIPRRLREEKFTINRNPNYDETGNTIT